MTGKRNPPETTVVTGAAGWLGCALLAALAAPPGHSWHPGHDRARAGRIRALVLHAADVPIVRTLSERIEVHVGDIADARVLDRLLRGTQGADILHCAGVIHPRRVREFETVNVAGTEAMIAAARRAGARRLVHVSSNSPFGVNPTPADVFRAEEPFNPHMGYGRSKMRAEIVVREAHGDGIETTVVRPPWFYGPHQPARQTRFLRALRRGRFPLLGDGRNRRSMVYIDNLVDGLVCAELEERAAGRAYWIADRRPYEMREIVDTTRRALADEGLQISGSAPRLPGLLADVAERADGLLQERERYLQELHVLGEMNKTIACDVSRAEAELGYEPRIELYEGMRRSVRWCLERGMVL
jgi:nucleoside-diphosphate-sugar epimerase